jgi:RimJ/RimL family protein N-acetyltransferase
MRHDIRLTGHGFALRPIELGDEGLIVDLRSDADRTRYLHRIVRDPAQQAEYLNRYFDRDGDYYFVIERMAGEDRCPEGLVSIYDLDRDRRRAEWGRWILRNGSLAAVESTWLIYRVAFERLNLSEVYCHTLSDNAEVLSFHDRAGLERTQRLKGLIEIDGELHDAIEHVLTRDRWPRTSANLERLAARLALRLTPAA